MPPNAITVRPPAVAGMFYPAGADVLRRSVERLLAQTSPAGNPPKALIVPHAGYVYSGPVAASGYARLRTIVDRVERVVAFGPAHRVPFHGIAAPVSACWRTPLGDIPIDQPAIEGLLDLSAVRRHEGAFRDEHSLEVQLPFLQVVLERFRLVPLLVGDARPEDVASALERLWGGPETLIVISSDLSHYHSYETASRIDAETSRAIVENRPEAIGFDQACGRIPVLGLMEAVARHGLHGEIVDQRNSGDTAGPRDRVVGYGSYAFS